MKLNRKILRKMIMEVIDDPNYHYNLLKKQGASSAQLAGAQPGGALQVLQSLIDDADSLAKDYIAKYYPSPQSAHEAPEQYAEFVASIDLAADRLAALADRLVQQSELKLFKDKLTPLDQASGYNAYEAMNVQLNDLISAYASNRNELGTVRELLHQHKGNKGLFVA
jgi:hypothetical protein